MLSEAEKIIRQFYEERKLIEFWLPKHSNWKHFRLNLWYGGWVKVKDRITTKQKLKKVLVRFAPINVYYGVAYFSNPTILGRRSDKISQNNFLFSDFVLDIDEKNLKKGKEIVKKNYEHLKNLGFKNISVRFTGGGWHLLINKWYTSRIKNPIEREKDCLKKMRKFADGLEVDGLKFDSPISRDTRRIIKLPGTLTKYGNLCEIVDISKIDDFKPVKVVDLPKRAKPLLIDDMLKRLK